MPPDPLSRFITEQADPLLGDLVPLAGALTRAAGTDNDVLYRAREADMRELLAGLCVHKLHALLIVAASELALLNWRPDPEVTVQ